MSTTTTTTIDAQWLTDRRTEGADLLVLDVRTPAAFESAHIEGSYNVPLDTLKEHREAAGQRVIEGAQRWDLERLVAGSVVLTSVLASALLPTAKWVAAGIGGGLTFAAISNTCAMGTMLSKLPYNRAASPDPQQLVARLSAR